MRPKRDPLPSRLLVLPALKRPTVKYGTVRISAQTFERIKLYADLTNVSVRQATEEVLSDWMDTIGEGRMELLTGQPMYSEAERMANNNVVSIELLN